MKGGKLPISEIKAFLEASYDVNDSKPEINGYILDKELSNKWGKVFYNQALKKAVVVHRGTRSATDWRNNAMIGIGAYQLTDRFKTGKLLQEEAEAKYTGYKMYTLGHSQAGQLVNLLGKNTTGISLNPAYTTALKGEFQGTNEFTIRSSLDPVSGLTKGLQSAILNITNPNFNKRNNIVIPAETNDLLKEHSLDILDRLPQDMLIGRGKSKMIVNMKKLNEIKKLLSI
jgi:uncharacterized protein (DUF2164 family)